MNRISATFQRNKLRQWDKSWQNQSVHFEKIRAKGEHMKKTGRILKEREKETLNVWSDPNDL